MLAFQEDHAVLGGGFHRISTCLRGNDIAGARTAAAQLDRDAGAHIAFEEQVFYPALVPLLGEDDVAKMHDDHGQGLAVIQRLLAAGDPTDAQRRALLAASETMEQHIAECGELFGAMGRISEAEQSRLLEKLEALRAERPRWTHYAAGGG